MKVTPKTEKEVSEENLLPEGVYDFEIMEAVEKLSKGGNDMIALKIAVYGPNGNARYVFDYLLEVEGMSYKIRHAADACGILEKYEAGEVTADDFKNKTGKLKLFIQKGKDGYADKNSVRDYIKRSDLEAVQEGPKAAATVAKDLDDEIPF